MKTLSLLAMLCMTSLLSISQATYDATLPIYTSDAAGSLQGFKQRLSGSLTNTWTRPGASVSNLTKYIGAMAVNPNNLSQVFFVDNSSIPVLYVMNKGVGSTGAEINTAQTFAGASQGANTTTLPQISSESTFGVNMMAIRKTANTGYAISKDYKLYSFSTASPYTVSAGASIADEAGNAVSFTTAKGGGLMANDNNKLTALVNVPIVGGFKYCYFNIDPVTNKAKYVKDAIINYYGFDDNTMYISGAGVTQDGSIYTSLYSGAADGTLYQYNAVTNTFDSYLSTNSQVIGEITGAGQVKSTSGLLTIDFTDIFGSYNAPEKTTTIKWGVSANEPINKFNVQVSTDGTNFKTVASQTASALNGQTSYKQVVNSTNNSLVYYRIAAVRANNTEKYSTVAIVDETNNTKPTVTTYPNPATYFFTLKLLEPKAVEQINIVDSRGAGVAQIKVGGEVLLSKQINISQYNLKNGQYFVKLTFSDNQKQTIPLTIKN